MSVETLKRINLDKVREAFIQAGITSSKGVGHCVMVAVCYPASMNIYNVLGFDRNYVCGVIDGWDDWKDRSNEFDQLKYRLGRADGKSAARIMGM